MKPIFILVSLVALSWILRPIGSDGDTAALAKAVGPLVSVQKLNLSCVNSGVQLYCYETTAGSPEVAFMHVCAVKDHRRVIFIDRFSQLGDLVNITSPTQALEFARLRTAPTTGFLFRRTEIDYEVLNSQNYIPDYGVHDDFSYVSGRFSGLSGILSPGHSVRADLKAL